MAKTECYNRARLWHYLWIDRQ